MMTDRQDYEYDEPTNDSFEGVESDSDTKYVWCNVANDISSSQGNVVDNSHNSKEMWSVELQSQNDGKFKFKIDSAAEVNVMSKTF